MNLEQNSTQRQETIHVSAPSVGNTNNNRSSAVSSGTTSTTSSSTAPTNTMPQRTPFAIQELLGLSESTRSSSAAAVTAVTPPSFYTNVGQTPFSSEHHQMQMAASRMAYFNAHAAVAAAFSHNMAAGAAGGPLSFTPQGKKNITIFLLNRKFIIKKFIFFSIIHDLKLNQVTQNKFYLISHFVRDNFKIIVK